MATVGLPVASTSTVMFVSLRCIVMVSFKTPNPNEHWPPPAHCLYSVFKYFFMILVLFRFFSVFSVFKSLFWWCLLLVGLLDSRLSVLWYGDAIEPVAIHAETGQPGQAIRLKKIYWILLYSCWPADRVLHLTFAGWDGKWPQRPQHLPAAWTSTVNFVWLCCIVMVPIKTLEWLLTEPSVHNYAA